MNDGIEIDNSVKDIAEQPNVIESPFQVPESATPITAAAITNSNEPEDVNKVSSFQGLQAAIPPAIPPTISEHPDGNNVHFRKQKRTPSYAGSNMDGKTPGQYGVRPTRISSQYSIGGHSVGGQSSHSQHSSSDIDHLIPPPSTDKEKSKMTRRTLATVFGLMYVIFLVTFSGVVFIGNAVVSQYPLAEAYLITIILIGFIYFIFLYIDIRKHVEEAKRGVQDREKRHEMWEEQMAKHQAQFNGGPMELSSNGNGITPIEMPVMDLPPVKPLSHKYCFATGRHGEFFYLKIGATWFCFGLLIHSILIISYQVIFMTSTDYDFQKCASIPTLIFDVLFPLYSIFVLFFIFKYANVIINEFRGLARLALMHAIGASLSFWIWTIVRETVDAINMKYYYKPDDSNEGYFNITVNERTLREGVITDACPGPEALNVIYRNFSPYLYPFIIEFCILISGIFYMIYANINKCPRRLSAPGHEHTHDVTDEAETFPGSGITHDHHNPQKSEEEAMSEFSEHCRNTTEHENQYKSNLVIHADCHAANRGLFAGLVLMILTIVFIILFFVATSEEDYIEIGILMDSIFEFLVLGIMVIAVKIAYIQISHLDVNHHPISLLDDVLLFIAVPAFFLETIFSMVPAIYNSSHLNTLIIGAQLTQMLLQTPFICDGMRRCSNSKALRKTKPGRELITFLTIANVSLWIYYTFSVKNAYTGDERYEFYGDVLWTILNHLSLPLIMFYRFHASVCLVDIWRHAYEPGDLVH